MKPHQVALFVLVLLLVAAVGVAAYLYGQNRVLNSGNPENSTRASVSPVLTQVISITPPAATQSVLPPGGPTTITIDAELSLPPQDVTEITTRNINPFLDWQKDQHQKVTLIKVVKNGNSATYPYKFEYAMASGANGGYLIPRKDGHLDWFMPECLNVCSFTDSFKAKYPEIISQY